MCGWFTGPATAHLRSGSTCLHQSSAVCGRNRHQLHHQHHVSINPCLFVFLIYFTHMAYGIFSLSSLLSCFSSRRSSTFPYSETPLYTQTTATQYYEGQQTPGSQASTPGTPLTVSVTTGTTGGVSMFVAQPTSATAGGATVVTTCGTTNGAGEGAGTNGGTAGSYVIQGGYMLSSSSNSGGAANNTQSYSHTARASPATVSITEGEESSVPSADKKVCRGATRRNLFSFLFASTLNTNVAHADDVIVLSSGTHNWKYLDFLPKYSYFESRREDFIQYFKQRVPLQNKTKPWPHHFHIIQCMWQLGILFCLKFLVLSS